MKSENFELILETIQGGYISILEFLEYDNEIVCLYNHSNIGSLDKSQTEVILFEIIKFIDNKLNDIENYTMDRNIYTKKLRKACSNMRQIITKYYLLPYTHSTLISFYPSYFEMNYQFRKVIQKNLIN